MFSGLNCILNLTFYQFEVKKTSFVRGNMGHPVYTRIYTVYDILDIQEFFSVVWIDSLFQYGY